MYYNRIAVVFCALIIKYYNTCLNCYLFLCFTDGIEIFSLGKRKHIIEIPIKCSYRRIGNDQENIDVL